MSRLWRASPLTYLALLVAACLSIFPLYCMFVVATRSQRRDGPGAAAAHRPAATSSPTSPGCFDNTDAHFGPALLNSVIVAASVTVSVVFFSTLAGFAFAKLRFRGRNALLLVIIATMMVPDPARHHPALHADDQAGVERPTAGGDRAGAGHRVRRVLHAAVRRPGASATS